MSSCASTFFGILALILVTSTSRGSFHMEGFTDMLPAMANSAPNMRMALGQVAHSHRMKRKVVIVPLSDPQDCIGKCAQAMHDRVNRLFFNDNDTDADKMMKFCQTYAPFGACFPACPDSKLKTLVSEFFPVMNLLCQLGAKNYTDLIERFDCLDRNKEVAEQKCEAQCGNATDDDDEQEAKVHLNILPNFVIYENNQTKNTDIIRQTCRYLACMDKCSEPIIEAACGKETVKLEDKFVSTMLTSLLTTFKEMNAIETEPSECKPLVTAAKRH